LELGGGQGRDALWLADRDFEVHVLDYSHAAIQAISAKAEQLNLGERLSAAVQDVRQPLPLAGESFDACYSHMLYCMALTTAELRSLSREVWRVLRPGESYEIVAIDEFEEGRLPRKLFRVTLRKPEARPQ
jgi:ubiquinone/menaquinone biosynthesis C-methylase UbiE